MHILSAVRHSLDTFYRHFLNICHLISIHSVSKKYYVNETSISWILVQIHELFSFIALIIWRVICSNFTFNEKQSLKIYIIFSGFVSQIVGISYSHYCFRLFYFHTLVEGTNWDNPIHFLVPNEANARHVCLLLSVNRVYGDCFDRLGNSTGIGCWRGEIYTAEMCRDVGNADRLR